MNQQQKYIWLIETIRRAGKISFEDISDRWKRNRGLSNGEPLARATFNRWKDAICDIHGIKITCQRTGGYLYTIENPEVIDEDRLKKWMLDSFAVSNIISENIGLKDRILVEEIPSGRHHLTTLLSAMKENRRVNITHKQFAHSQAHTFSIAPYCVKLFENRWYVLAENNRNEIRLYGLDRIENIEYTDDKFKLPKNFSATDFFATAYGVIVDDQIKPERIVIRAYENHKHYLLSLPLHHSQRLIADNEEENYAEFELYLSPTYDLAMKLMQAGPLVEVMSPSSLRQRMKEWVSAMAKFYNHD